MVLRRGPCSLKNESMKNFHFFLLLIAVTVTATSAQPAIAKPVTQSAILVEAPGTKALSLTAADIAKLPRKEVRGKDHDGKESVYSGVEVREVLKLAGVKFGRELRGAGVTQYLVVEAADGYKAVFALPELDLEFTVEVVILADTQDGKPLSEKDGKYQVIVPAEKRHARWVRQVTALRVRTLN